MNNINLKAFSGGANSYNQSHISINNPLAYYGSLSQKQVNNNKYLKKVKHIPIEFDNYSTPIVITPVNLNRSSISINDLDNLNKNITIKTYNNFLVKKYGLNKFTVFLIEYKNTLISGVIFLIIIFIIILTLSIKNII
jgi:hypothetical protein